MTLENSTRKPHAPYYPRLTQPVEMRTDAYVYGVDKLNGYDAWALFEACAFGDMPTVEALLRKDPRLVNAQYWYQFPIHMAVREGHLQIVELLLSQGADPGQSRFTYNSWDKLLAIARDRGHQKVESILEQEMTKRFNYTPDFDVMKEAIIARDSRKVDDLILRQLPLISATDALGNNALHWSVITRQMDLIGRFIDAGTPIDAQRADGQTPLLLAVNDAADYWYRSTRGRSHPSLRNAAVMVGALLTRGASYTISAAAAIGDQERVEQLLRQDPGLAGRFDSARVSPLSYAAREGHLHIVRLLLQHGADPNTPEDLAPNGRSLFEACCRNHMEVAALLLEHGADPNAGLDSSGCCLTIAEVYHGRRARPLQELLRRHGAYTPPYEMGARQMEQAILERREVIQHEEFIGNLMRKRNIKLMDALLEADPTVIERMEYACAIAYPKSPAMVRRLLASGLDPNRTDWLGRTFLHACAEHGDRPVAELFLNAGADLNARDLEFKGTPLAAAVRSCSDIEDPKKTERSLRMVRFLLKRGAATNLPGDEPWATPMAWARNRGIAEIEELLRQHGAH